MPTIVQFVILGAMLFLIIVASPLVIKIIKEFLKMRED